MANFVCITRQQCIRMYSRVIPIIIRIAPNQCIQRFQPSVQNHTLAAVYPVHQPVACLHTTAAIWGDVVPFKLSDIGEGITEVTLKEWFVSEGDTVAQFESICEVQSDKASVTITSRFDGKIKKLYYKVDETALVGKPLVDVELAHALSSTEDEELQETEAIAVGSASDIHTPGGKALATPAVRRLATENQIQLSDITGTGKGGRVLKEDVINYMDNKNEEPVVKSDPQVPLPPKSSTAPVKETPQRKPIVAPIVADRVEPIKGVMKAMVKSMSAVQHIPQFGYSDEITVDALVRTRKEMKKGAEERGVRLSYMPFFIKAASLALNSYPILNSSFDEKNEKIIYKAAHNIGVAMDTAKGLLVPNVKNVQHLTLFDIASELNRLHDLGMKGSLGTNDLTGGTFTLSNIGTIGGTYCRPILMPPEVIIGAIAKMIVLPRFDNKGQVIPTTVLYISWSADHRIIDGATVAKFSNIWKMYLESPARMLADMK